MVVSRLLGSSLLRGSLCRTFESKRLESRYEVGAAACVRTSLHCLMGNHQHWQFLARPQGAFGVAIVMHNGVLG